MRKLPQYYQFDIDTTNNWPTFLDTNGNPLPDYKSKLTKGQWLKASQYLTRELIPFCGYTYKLKQSAIDLNQKIIKIR